MGMFDWIVCEYPLPELPDDTYFDEAFQTKSLDCHLDHYTITKEGTLILHSTEMVGVPEEERPYYGTPDWNRSEFLRLCGSYKSIPTGDVIVDLTDTIRFYTSAGDYDDKSFIWYEWVATFKNGKLVDIQRT